MVLKGLTPPATIEYEDISDDEDIMSMQQEPSIELKPSDEEEIVHVPNELSELKEDESPYDVYLGHRNDSQQEEATSISREMNFLNNNKKHYRYLLEQQLEQIRRHELKLERFHVQNETIELQLFDESYDGPLPDYMIPHFDKQLTKTSDDSSVQEQNQQEQQEQQERQQQQDQNEEMMIHVENETHQVRNFDHLGPNSRTATSVTRKQIRNRKSNRRLRLNRYRYEVIREVYPSFSIGKIKNILKSMNIFYVNINMIRRRLYIGLKNQTIKDEVEQQLHNRIFTEQHYHRLYK